MLPSLPNLPDVDYRRITSVPTAHALNARLMGLQTVVAVDCETIGVNPKSQSTGFAGELFCWSLAYRATNGELIGYWIPGPAYGPGAEQITECLKPWLASEQHAKLGHNWWGFDANIFARAGYPVAGVFCDTMHLSKVLPHEDKARHGLKELTKDLWGYHFGKFADLFSEIIPGKTPVVIPEEKRSRRKLNNTWVSTLLIPGEYPKISKKPKRRYVPLDEWLRRYPDKQDVLEQYSTLDAVFTVLIYEKLAQRAKTTPTHRPSENFFHTYRDWFVHYGRCLSEINLNGIGFAAGELTAPRSALLSEAFELKQRLGELGLSAPDSPKQNAAFLYGELGLPIPEYCGSGQATKRNFENKPVTDEIGVRWLLERHPKHAELLGGLLRYKKAVKLAQFCTSLPKYDHGGRIHPRLSPDTDTGRLSCTMPNLQQIPKSDPYGIRKAFRAKPGHLLCIADYSQMEMVVLAHICISLFHEHTLAEALGAADFHSRTAQLCWPRDYASDPKRFRKYAKAINYGINYGKSAAGLAVSIGVTKTRAEEILADYFAAFPEVELYRDYMQNQARTHGWVPMLDGRRRLLPAARFSRSQTQADDFLRALHNKALRQALNTPIQGSAAAIVNRAMGAVVTSRELQALGAYPVLQIHDELILEVPEDRAPRALEELTRVMIGAVPLRASLRVDGRISETWLASEDH